jgi:hypothetical protein
MAPSGDTLLYVADASGLTIEMFDIEANQWRGAYQFLSRTSQLDVWNGTLVAGMVDRRTRTSAVVVAGERADWVRLGPYPAMFTVNDDITVDLFGSIGLAVRNDTLITSYEISDYLYLTPLRGGLVDSLYVPALRRRGARADLFRQITDDPVSAAPAVNKSSWPAVLEVLPSGLIALVALDFDWVDSRVQGVNYLSLVDLVTRRTCADAAIPGPIDPAPRVAFRGDTLFALSRDVDLRGAARTVVRKYALDLTSCTWLSQEK